MNDLCFSRSKFYPVGLVFGASLFRLASVKADSGYRISYLIKYEAYSKLYWKFQFPVFFCFF